MSDDDGYGDDDDDDRKGSGSGSEVPGGMMMRAWYGRGARRHAYAYPRVMTKMTTTPQTQQQENPLNPVSWAVLTRTRSSSSHEHEHGDEQLVEL